MKSIRITCKSGYSTSIDELKPLQGDLKELSKENYAKLKKEIITEGFDAPFFVWTESADARWILDGHQRLRTLIKMREEGFEVGDLPYIPIEAQDMAEAKRKLLGYASQYGSLTSQGLYEFMSNADIPFDEMDSRFRFPEIKNDQFKDEYYQDPVVEGEDDVPTIRENTFVASGNFFILGNHRILCGDSTLSENVNRLMNGEKADMVYTDPPYGVNYDGGTTLREKLKGDDTTDLYAPACLIAYEFSIDEAPLYIWHAGTFAAAAAAAAAGYKIRSELIWNKNMAQFGALSAQYKQKHEPFYYCFKKGKTVNWNGPTNEVSVWDVKRESKNEFHPTQKPVELAERAIKNHTVNSVLDLFLGSGSTLIACEKLKKKCFGIELNPLYVSVIIERWQKFSGKQAFRQSADGSLTSYEELKNG